MSNASGIRAGSAYIELTASDAALVRGLENARKRLRAFSVSIATVGRKLMLAATVSAAPFIMSSKAFASFEQQIAEVSAVTQASAQDMRRLTEQARLLGRTTSYMAVEAAKGMTELGRAGFKPAEIEATIPHILNLARATRIELGEAATVTADTMRSMGLAASDAQRIVDVLGATANSSSTDIKLIAEALKYAAPAAQKAGASIEETAAAIGVMANNGVKGSMAGTALARIYVMLARADSQKVLRSMGIQAVDAAGNLRPVAQIMSELGEATKKMGSAQRISIFNAVVDRRGSLAAMSLANKSQYKAMRKELEGITGLTSRMAKQMANTLAGSFRRLRATIEGAAIEIGKALTPTLRSWMDTMRDSVNRIAEFIRYNGQAVVWLMKLTISAAAAGAALIALSIAGKIVAGSLAVLSFASAGVIISLKALANVGIFCVNSVKMMGFVSLAAGQAIGSLASGGVSAARALASLAMGGVSVARGVNQIGAASAKAFGSLMNGVTATGGALASFIAKMPGWASAAGQFGGKLASAISALGGKLAGGAGKLAGKAGSALAPLAGGIGHSVLRAGLLARPMAETLSQAVKTAVSVVRPRMAELFAPGAHAAKGIAKVFTDGLSAAGAGFAKLGAASSTAFSRMLSYGSTVAGKLSAKIATAAAAISARFAKAFAPIAGFAAKQFANIGHFAHLVFLPIQAAAKTVMWVMAPALKQVHILIVKIGGAITAALGKAFAMLGVLAAKAFAVVGPLLAAFAAKALAFIATLAIIAGAVWLVYKGIKAIAPYIWSALVYAFNGLKKAAVVAFNAVASAAKWVWAQLLESGRIMWSGLVAGFKRVAEVVKVVWGGVAQALAANDLEGAMRIVWAGIKVLWAEGIAELTEWWEALKTVISDLWDTKAMNVFIALWSTLKAGVMGVFAEMIRLWSWVKSLNPATMKQEMHIRDDIAWQEVMAKQARERRAVAISSGDRPGAAQATRDEEIANESIKNLKAQLDALLVDPKLAAKLRDLDKGIIAETNKAESAAANYGTRTPAQAAAEATRKAAGAANVTKSKATASAARQELADATGAAGVMDDLAEIFDRIPARTETIMRDLADFFSFEGPAGGSKAQKEMGASAAWAMSGPRSSQGTFSATAARFMGFGDVQERMATSLEAIEENTKDTADGLAGLGVSYG